MIVRALDQNGDWTFGKGQSNYLTKNDAIRQSIKTRLKSFKFNWFLDSQANIDWFNLIGRYSVKSAIESEIERVIIQTENVLSAVVDNLVIDERIIKPKYTVTTIYSSTFADSVLIEV